MATRPLRRLTLLLAAFAAVVLSCGREAGSPTAPGAPVVRYARGLSFRPVFPPILEQAGGTGAGIVAFDHVHLVLRHADGSIALDTVVTFAPGTDELTLTLTVPLAPGAPAAGEPLAFNLDYVNAAGVTVFHGGPVTVLAVPSVPGRPPPPPVTIPVNYTGPGASAAHVVIAPRSLAVFDGDGFTFTAIATDGGGTPIPGTPIVWTALDPTRATITAPAAGAGVALSVRGPAHIMAQLLTGPADTVTVQVLLHASTLAAQSGGGQSATVGTLLAQPVVARVTASDGVGVGGVPVTFAVASGGGSVGTASAITDASGFAQTTWHLGAVVGAQTVTASAAGLAGSPVTFTATSLAAVPTKLVVTAQPMSTTAGATLVPVAFTVQDAFSNTVTAFTGPVSVAFGANPGGAALGGTTTVNAVVGVATFATLTVNRVGTGYTLVASATGLTNATTTAFDIAAGPGSRLAFGSYPVAGATAGVTIDPITVLARDSAGNLATTFSGAVTLAVGTGPAGATLHGVTTKTAVNGVATFDAVSLTTAGSYTLVASASGVASATGPAFTLAAGAAPVITWTGATSTSWTDPTNWSPAVVPGAADSVYVPSSFLPHPPTISTPVTIKSLVVAGGCGPNITLNGTTLTIAATLIDGSNGCLLASRMAPAPSRTAPAPSRFPVANSVNGTGGTVILTGTGTLSTTLYGNLQITGGVHTLVGYASVSGITAVSGTAQINLNGQYFSTTTLATSSSGTVSMTNLRDYLNVTGNATFGGGSTAGMLTAGTLYLYGGFTQSGSPTSFAPSGAFKTVFAAASSNVTFANPATSFLQDVDIPAGSGMLLLSNVLVKGTLTHTAGSSAAQLSANAGLPMQLTVSGLSQTGIYPMNITNVALTFLNGTTNAMFDNVNWSGFPATYTGDVFNVNRSDASPLSFNGHNFTSVVSSSLGVGGAYVRNSGTQSITFTGVVGIATPFTLTSLQHNP